MKHSGPFFSRQSRARLAIAFGGECIQYGEVLLWAYKEAPASISLPAGAGSGFRDTGF
ncbi:MAG: hypothetical protein H6577_27070 [Lewinellaceae bacterium]|nr:hypothetical protein [Saprospiraceae bacterium]MCB9341805.1 hypothetical protein [Lewinellaceae bacterium]